MKRFLWSEVLPRAGVSVLLLLATPVPNRAETSADTAAALKLLKSRCFSCHNEDKAKGGLVMTSHASLLKGGDSGAALLAGDPEKSPLITSLAPDADPHMPPKKQLAPEQIALLATWVKAGAPWDAEALKEQPRAVALAPLPGSYHPVLSLALAPDAKRLAAGCGHEVVIFEIGEKELTAVARASAHPDAIQSLAWSPDGQRIATGSFRRVVLWNASELAAEHVIREGLTDRISSVRFTPDSKRLVLADGRIGEEGTVRLADTTGGNVIHSWPAHSDTIFDLAVSADGKLLATAGGDRLVKIWELATQKEMRRIEAHAAQVLAIAFNADATQIVTGGADQQLKAWKVQNQDEVMLLGKHSAAMNALAWVPTGPAVFAATDAGGLLRYTDFKAHSGAQSSESATERKWEAADDALYCVAATSNAERVFAGTHDGRILSWNKDGKIVIKVKVTEPKETAASK